MLNTNINTTNILNLILEAVEAQKESQTPQTLTPVAQEVTPATPKYTKTIKTPKTPKVATIKSTFKSFSTQRGYYIPSQNKTNILEVAHATTLIISCITIGYFLTCKVNGVQQISVIGDDCHTDWKLKLQAGDLVEVEVLGGKSTKTITYTINEDGVVAVASEGVNHAIKGTHKVDLDIQDKYRKEAAQQVVEAPAPAQEVSAQIEEEAAPAQAEEQVITFGKHAGKTLSSLDSSYLKWLVSHEIRLVEDNRWASAAAKEILAARQNQEQKAA